MNSPYLQSTTHSERGRSNSNLSVHSAEHRRRVRKRSTSRSPSISAAHLDRLHQLALNESTRNEVTSSSSSSLNTVGQWAVSNASLDPQVNNNANVESFPDWNAPTPPHSDPDVPSLSVDQISSPTHLDRNTPEDFLLDPPTTSADMR